MPENKPRRLNEVVPPFAPQGSNDRRWFMIEHLLMDAKNDVQIACDYLKDIEARPENPDERRIAAECLHIMKRNLRSILSHHAWFLSYLSDTDMPERIARKEL